MIKKTYIHDSKVTVTDIVSLGYLYNEAERKIMVDKSITPLLKDKYGETYPLTYTATPSSVLLVELNMYKDFEYDIVIKVNKSDVIIPFSLIQQNIPAFGITYKFYPIGGHNNYCLAILYDTSVDTISFNNREVKKVGNCLGNVKGQIIGYTTIVDPTLNSYRTLTTKSVSSIDTQYKPFNPFLELNTLDLITYKVGV